MTLEEFKKQRNQSNRVSFEDFRTQRNSFLNPPTPETTQIPKTTQTKQLDPMIANQFKEFENKIRYMQGGANPTELQDNINNYTKEKYSSTFLNPEEQKKVRALNYFERIQAAPREQKLDAAIFDPLGSALLGAADTASLGLAEKAAQGLTGKGLYQQTGTKNLQEENKAANVVGKIAGYAAPYSAISKGLQATQAGKGVTQLGTKITTALAPKVGEKAATAIGTLVANRALDAPIDVALGATEGLVRGQSGKEIAQNIGTDLLFGTALDTVGSAVKGLKTVDNSLNIKKELKDLNKFEADLKKQDVKGFLDNAIQPSKANTLPNPNANKNIELNLGAKPTKNNNVEFNKIPDKVLENEKIFNETGRLPEPENKIILTKTKPKLPVLENATNNFETLYKKFVDNVYPTKKIGTNTLVQATNSKKAAGTVNYILENKLVNQQGQELGKGLKEIVTQIPESKQQNFWDYMMHKHSADRFRQGKPVFDGYSDAMSAAKAKELLNANPEFANIETDIRQFLDNFGDEWLQKTGLISPESRTAMKEMYPNYLPTNRVFDELEKLMNVNSSAKGFVNTGSGVKAAKGSTRDIENPIGSIMNIVNRTVRNARYNQVGQEMLKTLRDSPEQFKKYAEIVPTKQTMVDDINKIMNDDGIEGLTSFMDKQYDSVFNKATKGDNIVTVLENGIPVQVKINNKDLLETLKGLYKSQTSGIENAFKKATGVFKSLITQKNPIFALRNLARDIPTGYVYGSEANPIKYAKDLAAAGVDLVKNSDKAKQFKALGGEISGFFDSTNVEKAINNLTQKDNVFKKTGKNINNAIEYFNNLTESASRLAEFKRVLDKTGDVQKALYASGEITTNFARGGNVTKTGDSFVPYLNASVQGLDKLIRQFKNKPLQTIAKGGTIITAPTVALHLINKDNPNYQQLDNRTKDNYFLIPLEDGTFIKIPKSRELGVLFGSLFERVTRQVNNDKNAFKGFGNTLATNFSPNNLVENNILSPLVYNLPKNKDFANRTIVPIGVQDRSPRYQYDEKTSEIGKFIGDLINVSPKQINYLIDSYTGVIGDFVLPSTTQGQNPLDTVKRQFVADPLYSNQAITDFYDTRQQLKQLAADKNFTENIPSKRVTLEERQRNAFDKVSKELSSLYDEITKLQIDKNLTKEQKEKQIQALRIEIIKKARQANQKTK